MTRDEQIDQLLRVIQIADDESTVRVCPQGQQRFSINARGVATGQQDYPANAYGYHGLYVDGRACVQVAPSVFSPEEEADLTPVGVAPLSAALRVQPTNIPDRVGLDVWTGDRVADDGRPVYAGFFHTADSHRPHSKNVGVRSDAVNSNSGAGGTAQALESHAVADVPEASDRLDYPGDAWVRHAYDQFVAAVGSPACIFFARTLYDIGANTDQRPAGDWQFYLDKHLREARA